MKIMLAVAVALVLLASPVQAQLQNQAEGQTQPQTQTQTPAQAADDNFGASLAVAALMSAGADIRYNGAYVILDYPWGDVPPGQGVCSDVVIRAYRALDIDLQRRVHEDMKAAFDLYPSGRIWGLSRPDPNIDHRRVLNLEVFFERHGQELRPGADAANYQPGDLVTWMVPKFGGGTTPHIGIVTGARAADGTPLVVHHLSGRPRHENVLFAWPVKRHYRYQVAAAERDR